MASSSSSAVAGGLALQGIQAGQVARLTELWNQALQNAPQNDRTAAIWQENVDYLMRQVNTGEILPVQGPDEDSIIKLIAELDAVNFDDVWAHWPHAIPDVPDETPSVEEPGGDAYALEDVQGEGAASSVGGPQRKRKRKRPPGSKRKKNSQYQQDRKTRRDKERSIERGHTIGLVYGARLPGNALGALEKGKAEIPEGDFRLDELPEKPAEEDEAAAASSTPAVHHTLCPASQSRIPNLEAVGSRNSFPVLCLLIHRYENEQCFVCGQHFFQGGLCSKIEGSAAHRWLLSSSVLCCVYHCNPINNFGDVCRNCRPGPPNLRRSLELTCW